MYKSNQKGFSLVMVMMILVILAMMIIGAAHMSNTEMRVSSNDADYKYAVSLAEQALQAAEQDAFNMTYASTAAGGGPCENTEECAPLSDADIRALFREGVCDNGLCSFRDGVVAWEQPGVWDDVAQTRELETPVSNDTSRPPRYMLEFLGTSAVDGVPMRVFRVTARAWGKNGNTSATLQSILTTDAEIAGAGGGAHLGGH